MPRLNHVKKAAKDYPAQGIKKGEPYWWSQEFRGPKRLFKTQPRPSQYLGGFEGSMAEIEERMMDLEGTNDLRSRADVKDDISTIIDDIRALGEEEQEKFDNMPEGFQQGDTGQMLEERANACENMASEIEGFADELDEEEADAPVADIIESIKNVSCEV